MNINTFKYDGSCHNLKNHLSLNYDLIIIDVKKDFSELEILGIGSILEKYQNIYTSKTVDIIVSIGKYNENHIDIKSVKKVAFGIEVYTKRIELDENIKSKDLLKNSEKLICIEINKKEKKNDLVSKITSCEKNTFDIFPEEYYFQDID